MKTYRIDLFSDEPTDAAISFELTLPDGKVHVLMFEKLEFAEGWLKYVESFEHTTFDDSKSQLVVITDNLVGWVNRCLDVSFSKDDENSFVFGCDQKDFHLYFASTASMHNWQRTHLVKLAPIPIKIRSLDVSLPL